MAHRAVSPGNMSPQSDMSTPTEQFAGLSIDAAMPPSSAEVKRRALIIQDILSSFDDQDLPSEFRASLVSDIDRPPRARPDREAYFIRQDLSGTILNWGAYDDNFWRAIKEWRRPRSQAVIFSEKLGRKFNQIFEAYDAMFEAEPEDGPAEVARELSTRLIHLTQAAQKDPDYWIDLDEEAMQDREERTCQVLLEALRKVCERTAPFLVPASPDTSRRSSRRIASESSTPSSLFDLLIKLGPLDGEDLFMLPALQATSGPTLKACFEDLLSISDFLDRLEAPPDYIQQFGALQEKASNDSDSVANRLPPSPTTAAGPKTGTKRSQPPGNDTPTRRGKRRGAK